MNFCEFLKRRRLGLLSANYGKRTILLAVPPHQLLIYDSSGVQVDGVAGPFQVGVEFGLSCEVRGGELSNKYVSLAWIC